MHRHHRSCSISEKLNMLRAAQNTEQISSETYIIYLLSSHQWEAQTGQASVGRKPPLEAFTRSTQSLCSMGIITPITTLMLSTLFFS